MLSRTRCRAALLFLLSLSTSVPLVASAAFAPSPSQRQGIRTGVPSPCSLVDGDHIDHVTADNEAFSTSDASGSSGRRSFLASLAGTASAVAASAAPTASHVAAAAERSTTDAVVTDKIFLDFKGLPVLSEDAAAPVPSRIVVGLFGQDAPQPVSLLKQLVSPGGLPTKCKPLDTSRVLQREQLEANKVYNACKENEDSVGVNYDYSSVWRVDRDHRIDVGAVSGKFVARENPNFVGGGSGLSHDAPGVVSVRRGNDGGFGFTIYPGGKKSPQDLDEDNVVVGRVLEGMDVVQKLNELPVVQSANVNYMGLTGGPMTKNAPSRACRYGGPMYCNELKPLKKVLVEKSGVLST